MFQKRLFEAELFSISSLSALKLRAKLATDHNTAEQKQTKRPVHLRTTDSPPGPQNPTRRRAPALQSEARKVLLKRAVEMKSLISLLSPFLLKQATSQVIRRTWSRGIRLYVGVSETLRINARDWVRTDNGEKEDYAHANPGKGREFRHCGRHILRHEGRTIHQYSFEGIRIDCRDNDGL